MFEIKIFDHHYEGGIEPFKIIGNTNIEVMEPPGNTEETISLFYGTEEDGVKYQVETFGGAGENTLARERFDYPEGRECYLDFLNKLR